MGEDEDWNVLGGSNLDFLVYNYIVDAHGDIYVQTSHMQGKIAGGGLKSATFKILSGLYWEKSHTHDEIHTGQISGTGKLIPESQIPPEIR